MRKIPTTKEKLDGSAKAGPNQKSSNPPAQQIREAGVLTSKDIEQSHSHSRRKNFASFGSE